MSLSISVRTVTARSPALVPVVVREDAEVGRYVVVERSDIEKANELAHPVLGRCLDELPPQTRRLLDQLEKLVTEECAALGLVSSDYHFTRRFLRQR